MTSSAPVEFIRSVPVLPVGDIAGAVAFYQDGLGFETRFAGDDYAVFECGGVAVHAWLAAFPHIPGAEPHLAGSGACWIAVDSVTALVDELGRRAIGTRPAGDDAVIVEDPFGNRITFHSNPS